MTFPSVYEMKNPLTTVRKQHFWEYFSGATLNSRWTTALSATGTATIKDEIDGGISLTSGTTAYNISRIDFGNAGNTGSPTYQTTHGLFSPTGHEWVAVFKWVSGATSLTTIGLTGGDGDFGNYQSGFSAILVDKSGNTIKQKRNTGTLSLTLGTVDTNWHSAKNTLSGGTLATSIDGVLSGTGYVKETSGMPTVKSAPFFSVYATGTAGGAESRLKYFEAYNT